MRLRVVLVLAGAVTLALGGAKTAGSAPTELFFSEYVEGSSNNKAIEIYNGTGEPVSLAGYWVAMYFNGNPVAGLAIDLNGTIASGDVHVLAHSSADPAILAKADQTNGAGWFNGDDAVVLMHGTQRIDVIGQTGFDPGTEWGTGVTSTADNTLRRKLSVVAGDADGTNAFDPAVEWDGFPTNTFDGLGGHGSGGGGAVTVSCPGVTTLQGNAATGTVTSTDPDGRVVALDITSVSPQPSSGSISRTAFTPAAETGGAASATVSVSDSVPAGTYTVTWSAANDDAPVAQSATCAQTVTVRPVLTIGAVQGSVSDTDNGTTHTTPFNNRQVTIRGVIYQKTLQRSSAGVSQYGFFIQNTFATADSDPNSSDGIFVFQNRFPDLIGGYVPQVGDEVVISGNAAEFFNLTQLSSARLEQLVRSNVPLDLELPAFDVNPPDDLAAANRYWERREGMRGLVPANTLSLDGRDVFPSTMDGEAWVMRGDHPLAQRSDPYARRSFRDPHPLDNRPELFDDANGYRILLASLGLKAATGDHNTLIAPTRTFDRITNAMVGGVYFGFNKYSIQVGQQPELVHGVEPADNNPPTRGNRRVEYSLADYNVENLYDYRDDPFDGCDFATNAGCPGVRPPFDYVPASDEVYQARLGDIARQIIDRLHSPDIVMTQEGEDQDICTVQGNAFQCGTVDNADGKPDSLQELALAIERAGGPEYDAAYDRNGADDRGIVSGFMYRTDRVQLLAVTADDPLFGSSPQVQYRGTPLAYNNDVQNPKVLNAVLPADVDRSSGVDGGNVYTRAPQVGSFRIWRTGVGRGGWVDLYAISNHFSSTPDGRVGQRKEQSAYNAAIIDVLDESRSRVITAGDFNVFPRPDDPFAPGHPRYPSDQLGPLYDFGMNNLWDVAVAENASAAYSYVFVGQVQTLDGQFVTDTLLDELVQARIAHVNADYPADYPDDGPVGLSDHDPMVSRYALAPTLPRLAALLAFHRGAADAQAWKALSERLDRAEAFLASGQLAAYRAQLQAFANQALGFAPNHLTQAAADALADEANLLRNS